MDHIMTYEEYLRDVKKGIVTDLGNSPVTPLLLMLQGKWKTQILYERTYEPCDKIEKAGSVQPVFSPV